MEVSLLILGGLGIPLAVVVIIVIALRKRVDAAGVRGATSVGGATSSVRRFFQYLLLFALTVVATIGAADLLGRALVLLERRHPMLRVRIRGLAGEPRQQVLPASGSPSWPA